MTIRSETDIVLASNSAQDLTKVVFNYLSIYKKYANGKNGVKIPDESFSVLFKPMRKDGFLSVCLVYTRTTQHQVTEYYDVDDDNFSEVWGSDNSCGYSIKTTKYVHEDLIDIPFSQLLCNLETMKKNVLSFVERDNAKIAEKLRVDRIATLESELTKLRLP